MTKKAQSGRPDDKQSWPDYPNPKKVRETEQFFLNPVSWTKKTEKKKTTTPKIVGQTNDLTESDVIKWLKNKKRSTDAAEMRLFLLTALRADIGSRLSQVHYFIPTTTLESILARCDTELYHAIASAGYQVLTYAKPAMSKEDALAGVRLAIVAEKSKREERRQQGWDYVRCLGHYLSMILLAVAMGLAVALAMYLVPEIFTPFLVLSALAVVAFIKVLAWFVECDICCGYCCTGFEFNKTPQTDKQADWLDFCRMHGLKAIGHDIVRLTAYCLADDEVESCDRGIAKATARSMDSWGQSIWGFFCPCWTENHEAQLEQLLPSPDLELC